MSFEPLLTIPQLIKKWELLKRQTGNQPIPISARTLYRLIDKRKIRVHGFRSPLVYESEVIDDFRNSQYRKQEAFNGNPHMGREKEEVAAELDRRIRSLQNSPT